MHKSTNKLKSTNTSLKTSKRKLTTKKVKKNTLKKVKPHHPTTSASASILNLTPTSPNGSIRSLSTLGNKSFGLSDVNHTLTSSSSSIGFSHYRSSNMSSLPSSSSNSTPFLQNITTQPFRTLTTTQSSSLLPRSLQHQFNTHQSKYLPHFPTLSPTQISKPQNNPNRTFAAAAPNKNGTGREGEAGNISLSLEGITKKLESGRVLFSNITTSFYHGAKIGIVGKNGAGKSSLLKILAGVDKNIDGKIETYPGRVVGYLAQEPILENELSVMDNVLLGVGKQAKLLKRYDEIAEEFANEDADIDALIEEQAAVQHEIDELNCWNLHREIEVALEALCCPPPDHRVGDCSGGQKRRVALAKLLLSKPDVLLLDEPTNHLDAGSVQWLEQYLAQYEGLVVAITHDRYFLDNVAGYILEIENGRFFPHKGNYTSWVDAKTRRLELETAHNKALDKNLEREVAWMNQNVKGRQSKGKARLRKVEELQKQKEEYRQNRLESGSLVIPSGPRLGTKVIEAKNVGLAYNNDPGVPNNTVLSAAEIKALEDAGEPVPWTFRNVNFLMQPGQVMGIVGPNGIGKTTLFKTILGTIAPTAGEIIRGQSVVFGYNAQTREGLRDESTVWEEIAEGQEFIKIDENYSMHARQFVAQFNFTGQEQSKLIKHLSGGERNRVHLAKSLKQGTNVILLDEPTNDLDVDTLRSLEEAINSFDGCVFIVSHDRWFLDRVCTDILAFTHLFDSETRSPVLSAFNFQGNFSEFEKHFRETTGQEYVAQKSKKFRGLMD
jgi:ATPase subunit of ABC transporter with duplicated ATPase domains